MPLAGNRSSEVIVQGYSFRFQGSGFMRMTLLFGRKNTGNFKIRGSIISLGAEFGFNFRQESISRLALCFPTSLARCLAALRYDINYFSALVLVEACAESCRLETSEQKQALHRVKSGQARSGQVESRITLVPASLHTNWGGKYSQLLGCAPPRFLAGRFRPGCLHLSDKWLLVGPCSGGA